MKHGEIALPMRLKKEYRTPSHTTNPKSETMLKLAAHSNGCTSSALTTTNAAAHAFYPPPIDQASRALHSAYDV